jgi:hypothetical protein
MQVRRCGSGKEMSPRPELKIAGRYNFGLTRLQKE